MKYSEITEMSHPLDFRFCCGERMYVTPCCGSDVCLFCMNDCSDCGDEIDFTK